MELGIIAAISGSGIFWALVWVAVGALLFYLGDWFIKYMGLQPPFVVIAKAILGIAVFLFLVNAVLTLAGKPFIGWP